MDTAQESRVRTTDDGTQVWRITTTENLNVADGGKGDGDWLGSNVDFETLPHTTRMGVDDWIGAFKDKPGWCVLEREFEGGHLVMLMGMYFDQEFDRTSEQTYEVTVDVMWELESFG